MEYRAAVELQERLRARVIAGDLPDLLLLLEHPPVYTRGRRSEPGELPMGEDWYRMQGIDSIAIRHMTYLCMSWDHRALDGALAAQFLAALRKKLEWWN